MSILRVPFALTLIAFIQLVFGQNLVLNPSFEDTLDCEASVQCDLLRAVGWYNPNTASPDVYDCDLDRNCGQPMDPASLGIQAKGFQYSQDGLRHAGGYQWYGPGSSYTREYLMTELSQELQSGSSYEVGLFYSRAEGYSYAVDRISAYLGPETVFEDHPNNLTTVTPQVQLMQADSSYLVEGEDWVQLLDTFVAEGGERWLVIGTFLGPDQVNGVIATQGSQNTYAYYYFDQVSVRFIEGPHAISESEVQLSWSVDGVTIMSGTKSIESDLRVFDATGRLVRSWQGTVTGQTTISVADLARGAYVALAESSGTRAVARFVKED